MQLIENAVNPLSATSDKTLSGLFAEMDKLNQNERIYPEEIYIPAYEELIPKIGERRLLGELDHPIDYDEVRLSNVSHVIVESEVREEEGIKKIYGTVELLDTPAGLIAQALVKAGIPLGISSRGLGSTRDTREGAEVTQLKLLTYDLVAEPSFANAILSPDKSRELSDSLHYIESKLPLNESLETKSVRGMIHKIRESLINRKTTPTNEIDIKEVELKSLKGLLESTRRTLKSDTQVMIDSRREIKNLREELQESERKYKALMKNMIRLQDAYNSLQESTVSIQEVDDLKEELSEMRRQLAVEKRGMSYSRVSDLLEGANTDDEIENRLNSLSSISKRQSSIQIDSRLTESTRSPEKKLTGLAAIVSKV